MTKYMMPPEWFPHERTWMAWPSQGYAMGSDDFEAEEARATWASVANAIARFEPVTVLCNQDELSRARNHLHPSVTLVEAKLDDAWMRDIGPTFVHSETGQVVGVSWVFNGWGAQKWASWSNDSKIAQFVGTAAGKEVINSWLINEGGGIHVNGAGSVLLTETVQLGEGRNASKSKEEVETEIHKTLGTSEAIWIKRGLSRDYEEFGTRGHIDIVACFADERTILMHDQTNEAHPDYLVSRDVRQALEDFGEFKIVSLPAPTVLRDEEGWVDYSYVNHYVVNGGVILCSFDDPNDLVAKGILEYVYPGREIVLVDARALFARGGGIHCITQQQPRELPLPPVGF